MKMLPTLPNKLHLENSNAQHRHHNNNNNSHHHQDHHQYQHQHQHHSPSGSTTPKRGSSMIFRIEHLLPISQSPSTPTLTTTPRSTSSPMRTSTPPPTTIMSTSPAAIYQMPTISPISSNGTRRTKSSRSGGVYVKNFAPKDTVSESISSLDLMTSSSTVMGSTEPTDQQRAQQQTARSYCSITQGVLRITPAIMRKVKLSEDIHSYNALFEICSGDVRLRIVRDIAREEELIAWFDEEVTLLMSIPFLTPLNIQGNSRYTCHICHLTFETPNPLKIHLALACGRHTLEILWIRLHYTLKSTTLGQHSLPFHLVHHLSSFSPAYRPTPLQSNSSTSAITIPTISPSTSAESHRLSAFKPILSTTSAQISSQLTNNIIPPISTTTFSLPLAPHHTTTTTTSIPFLSTISSPTSVSTSASTSTSSLASASASASASISASAAALSSMNLLHPSGSNPLNAAAQIEAIVSNMGASKQGHLCIYCGKVYSRKYGLKIHIRTHTGFKPLKCKFCLRPFGDPSNLNKHVRLHLQSSASSSSGETIDGYKCHMCHKTLARRRDLQRHIESRHNNAS